MNMRYAITENIINNAINESINTFMIEEGFWDSMLGKNMKKAGNALKNGFLMYLDKASNGRFGAKWGVGPTGNGKTTEMYYLNQWFQYHLNEIRRISQYGYDPSSSNRETIEWTDENGKKLGNQTRHNTTNIGEYSARYITKEAFNTWIGNKIPNRQSLQLIDDYMDYCSKIQDVRTASQLLNIYNFMGSKYGKEYLSTSNDKLNNQRKQYQQQRIKKDVQGINNLFNHLYNNSKKITKEQLNNDVNYFNNTFNISNNYYPYVKQYINRVLSMLNNGETIDKKLYFLNANNFFKYIKKYNNVS